MGRLNRSAACRPVRRCRSRARPAAWLEGRRTGLSWWQFWWRLLAAPASLALRCQAAAWAALGLPTVLAGSGPGAPRNGMADAAREPCEYTNLLRHYG